MGQDEGPELSSVRVEAWAGESLFTLATLEPRGTGWPPWGLGATSPLAERG